MVTSYEHMLLYTTEETIMLLKEVFTQFGCCTEEWGGGRINHHDSRGCRRASSAFEWLFNHLKWSFTNYSETIRSFKRRIWGSFFQQVMSWNPKISIQFVVDVLFAQLKSIIAWINSGLSMPAAPHWRWMHEEIQRLRETNIKYNQKRDLPPWQDLEVIWSRVGGFPLSVVRL